MPQVNQKKLKNFLKVEIGSDKFFTLLCRALIQSKIATLNQNQIVVDESYLNLVTNIWNFITWVNSIHAENWINFNGLTTFLTKILSSKDKIINPFIIMCPSYIKNGEVGFNDALGRTSTVAIENLKYLSDQLNVFFPDYIIKPICYFGDLGIEQYIQKSDTFWDVEITKNIGLIQSFVTEISFNNLILLKLSDENHLDLNIGRAGSVDQDISSKFQKEILGVKIRNQTFYCDNLGWSQEDSDNRTDISATFYSLMGKYFNQKFEIPLFLYTANSYEKAVSYNFLNPSKNKLWIIYPKKINNAIIKF